MKTVRSFLAGVGVCFVLCTAPARAQAALGRLDGSGGTPPLRVFTARDTGVATMAWSAAQDLSGKMYFGCDTVISFDGDRWRAEKMDPTYLVRGLDVGENGRIWAAAVNQIGWFDPAPGGDLRYHSLVGELPAADRELGDVWRVYATGPNAAVFVAHDRVLRWDGQKMRAWDFPGARLLWSTRTAKGIYVDYPSQGLLRMTDQGPVVVIPAAALGPAAVGWLDDSGPDWLLMTTQGLKILHGGACTAVDGPASAFIRANAATAAVRLRDGTLAVATVRGGIALVDPSGAVLRVFNLRTGLPSNQVYALFVDREGALWGMGPAHIFRLGVASGTALYGPRSGYPPGGAYSLDAAAGSLFVASHSDILRLDPEPASGGAGVFNSLGLTSSRFFGVLALPQGIAIGHLHGLGLWARGELKPLVALDEPVFRSGLSHAYPGRIIASLADRVLSLDPATGERTTVAEGLPDYGDSLADEANGRVWIGTPSRGLYVAVPGTTAAVAAGPLFGHVPATGPAFVSAAQATIVALTGSGAYFLSAASGRFERVSGFPGGTPAAISNEDADGAVWTGQYPDSGGRSPKIGKITIKDSHASWTPQSFEGLSGLGSLLGLRIVPGAVGEELWMAGTEGLLRAGKAALAPRPPPRRPLIRAWVMADDPADGRPINGTLPYATRGVHIEYCSVDYGMRESEKFETLLGGAESQWSPPTDAPERDISGLREGSYDFQVRLVTDSGETGEAALLHFELAPPWWRTTAARVITVACAALAVLGLLLLRTRALRRRAHALERMVRQRTQELEKANAAKTEFVTSMSHEIRNPMGGILASALELSETPLEAGQQKLVATLQSCASFLASLVEDVLDFAAIEAGAYTVTRTPFSPRNVLDTVVKMLEPRAAPGCMHVAVFPDLPERIVGDEGRIQQVLVNYAVNALKFGGRTIWLSARSDEGHVVFTVADDGVGVPPDEQKNLFIRFSRLKPARNSAIPGTGLGLAVCRALAERMGGSVGYAPAPGGGSIFLLRLPLEAGDGHALPPAPLSAQGLKALVVEDINYNARALALMLGRLGFEASIVGDGEEALARLAAERFDAVFLDCDLPRIGGIEVARRFRAAEKGDSRTLVIATTALSTASDQSACLEAGMDAFVTKPITPQKLGAVLAHLSGTAAPETAALAGDSAAPARGMDLGMLVHLADGSPGSLERELGKYMHSLDEALLGVTRAHDSEGRSAVAAAAHRVISLARMVGAADLAATAVDIQDYAGAFTDAELAQEIAELAERASSAKRELQARAEGSSLSSFPAA